jgi:hypothetical protein
MDTSVTICFYYKFTDHTHHPAQLAIKKQTSFFDVIMKEFRKLNLSQIKFPGLGYGTVMKYHHHMDEVLGIKVQLSFPKAEYIVKENMNSEVNDNLPELFETIYFQKRDDALERTYYIRDYFVKMQFFDVYVLDYESEGQRYNIE